MTWIKNICTRYKKSKTARDMSTLQSSHSVTILILGLLVL